MKQKFKQKLILAREETWKSFKEVAKYYGREIPFALDDALKEYVKNKMKEIEKNEN